MYGWLQKALALYAITLPSQELKLRKGTGRGRGKREALPLVGEEEIDDYERDEGDFGFVEVLVWIVWKDEMTIFLKVEEESEGERARRAALLNWDGDYSHFQRDEVSPVLTSVHRPIGIPFDWAISNSHLPPGRGRDHWASSRSSQHSSQLETLPGFFLFVWYD